MSAVKLSSEEPFVYSTFGLQLPDGEESPEKRSLKGEFHGLIAPHATHFDLFVQDHDGCAAAREGKTFIWLGYWKSRAS
jgi:hypothetical protein